MSHSSSPVASYASPSQRTAHVSPKPGELVHGAPYKVHVGGGFAAPRSRCGVHVHPHARKPNDGDG